MENEQMRNRYNFLDWQFGNSQSFIISAQTPVGQMTEVRDRGVSSMLDGEAPLKRWVTLEDGRVLTAAVGDVVFELTPNKRSDLQLIRELIKSAPTPWMAKLELTASGNGTIHGVLTIVSSVLPFSISALALQLTEDIDITKDDLDAFTMPHLDGDDGEVVMMMRSNVQLMAKEGAPETIELISCKRDVLTCRIEQAGDGAQHLRIISYSPKDIHLSSLPSVRFIKLSTFPTLSDDVPERGSDLSGFLPLTSNHLSAWIEYEEKEVEAEKARIKRARPFEPEYISVESVTGAHTILGLKDFAEIYGTWVEVDSGRKAHSLDLVVEVVPPGKKNEDARPIEFEAVEFEVKRGKGFIKLDTREFRGNLPPRGTLRVGDSRGAAKVHERRAAALARLTEGSCPRPRLLEFLVAPRNIPEIRSKDLHYHRRKDGPTLDEQQAKAVIRAAQMPALFLIQGPPGTGKTTVITEIIHELRWRHRNAAGGNSLKVLVSSVQNDAVDNAAKKLGEGDILVDLITKDGDNASALAMAARATEEMKKRLEASNRYNALVELQEHLDALHKLRSRLSSPGSQSLEDMRNLPRKSLDPVRRKELDALARRLEALLEAQDTPARAAPFVAHSVMTDLRGLIERACCFASLDDDNVVDVRACVEGIVNILSTHGEGLPEEVVEALEVFELDAPRFLDRLQDPPSPRDARTWSRMVIELANMDSDGEQDREEQETPPTPLEQWERDAMDWYEGCEEYLLALTRSEGLADQAILGRFIEQINESPELTKKLIEEHAMVRGTTCQKAANYAEDTYDIAIIDEAARGGLDTLIPMTMARSIILIGDQNQLPPHIEQELERDLDKGLRDEVDLTTTSIFSHLWSELGGPNGSSNCVSLTKQFRMHRTIGELVSKIFYEPEIRLEHDCEGGERAKRAPNFGLLDDRPFVWIDTRDYFESSNREYNRPTGEQNAYEAELIVELVKRARLTGDDEGEKIGVIPFYGKQRKLLEQLLGKEGLLGRVELGTVDSFQGKDFPLVILSTVRSNREGRVGFLALPNRLNVAISRAKKQVILLGDSGTLAHERKGRGSESFKRLFASLSEDHGSSALLRSMEVFR